MDNATETKELTKKQKSKNPLGDIYDIIELFVFCTIAIITIFIFLGRLTIVNGTSMNKTLNNGDYLIVSDLGYEPKQGDIVVVQNISLDGRFSEPLVKRVIAVAGQTVDIDFDTWTVTVDGVVIDEPYIYLDPSNVVTSSWKYPLKINDGCIFVMGDNRNNSADSRSSLVGQIDKRCVVGRALCRLFPVGDFSILKTGE